MTELGEKDVSGSESGIATQVHFEGGRKPPQLKKVRLAPKKGCFGQIIFRRNALKDPIPQPLLKWAHPCGVPAE